MKILPYAETLVATIHHLYRKGSPRTQGTLFAVSVRIDVNDFVSDSEPPSEGGFVHLVIDASSNYVKVLAAFTERPARWLEVSNWVCVCDHDSAWREDGVKSTLRDAYNDISKQAAAKFGLPAAELSVHIAIADMDIRSREEILGDLEPSVVPRGRLALALS